MRVLRADNHDGHDCAFLENRQLFAEHSAATWVNDSGVRAGAARRI
jgi:hypothetical protein